MTDHLEGRLPGDLYWQGWTAPGPVKGAVVLVHGVHEHGGRYAHVGDRLAAAGYPLYVVDHVGHGRSPGVRGNIDRMATVVAGVHALVRQTARRHLEVPRFLYGHSLGGLIALEYLVGEGPGSRRHTSSGSAAAAEPVELAGAILSAPALDTSAATPLQRRMAGLLSRWTPNLGVLRLDATGISRDPEVVRAYRTDPLTYTGRMRARTGAEILTAATTVPRRLSRLTLPLLLIHGTADRIVPTLATELLAQHADSDDITIRIYDGFYHESHNEPEKEQVLDEIIAWLDRHR